MMLYAKLITNLHGIDNTIITTTPRTRKNPSGNAYNLIAKIF
jgi:hypothetical protein